AVRAAAGVHERVLANQPIDGRVTPWSDDWSLASPGTVDARLGCAAASGSVWWPPHTGAPASSHPCDDARRSWSAASAPPPRRSLPPPPPPPPHHFHSPAALRRPLPSS